MSFEKAVAAVLKHEGGYVNDTRDRGGETNFGITRATADANGYRNSMSSMTQQEAVDIYRSAYWNKCGLEGVNQVDEETAEKLFDIGVNMGIGTAGQFARRTDFFTAVIRDAPASSAGDMRLALPLSHRWSSL